MHALLIGRSLTSLPTSTKKGNHYSYNKQSLYFDTYINKNNFAIYYLHNLFLKNHNINNLLIWLTKIKIIV